MSQKSEENVKNVKKESIVYIGKHSRKQKTTT